MRFYHKSDILSHNSFFDLILRLNTSFFKIKHFIFLSRAETGFWEFTDGPDLWECTYPTEPRVRRSQGSGREQEWQRMKEQRSQHLTTPHKHTHTHTYTDTHPDSRLQVLQGKGQKQTRFSFKRRTGAGRYLTGQSVSKLSSPVCFRCVCAGCAVCCHATDGLHFIYLMQNILTVVLNGVKEWKVYREVWTSQRTEETWRHARRKKREEKSILVQLKANRKVSVEILQRRLKTRVSVHYRSVTHVSSEIRRAAPPRSSDGGVLSKATLCGVSVVEQLGLTVGQDLDLRRIWTLTDPRRHESVQILETGHLRGKRQEKHRAWRRSYKSQQHSSKYFKYEKWKFSMCSVFHCHTWCFTDDLINVHVGFYFTNLHFLSLGFDTLPYLRLFPRKSWQFLFSKSQIWSHNFCRIINLTFFTLSFFLKITI